jgi:hypothetical protein
MKKNLFLFFIAFLTRSYSQVYTAGTFLANYMNINPDVMINYVVVPYTNDTYSVSIFNNPSYDLEFTAHGAVSSSGSAAYIKVTSLDPNVSISFGRWDSVFVPGGPGWNVTKVAKPLNPGEQINASGTVWDNTTLYFTDHSGAGGGNKNVNDWIGGDKYLGVKYQNGNMTAYGWIKLQCSTKDTCLIKEYSSSQITTGLREGRKDYPRIYPNPISNAIYIELNEADVSDIMMSDLLGREVKMNVEVKDKKMKIGFDPDLPSGCYFLRYKTGSVSHVKKLVKEAR